MNDFPIRIATAEDWPAIQRLLFMVFHESADTDGSALRSVFEPERALVVTDPELADQVVGHASSYGRELTVPGAVLPAAYVSLVAVAPTHTRRGLMRRLMHRQLPALAEPVAVLWASEPALYPRFGYGMATTRADLTIETPALRLPEPGTPGRVRLATTEQVRGELRQVYESARAQRPAWAGRSGPWWDYVLRDLPSKRRGATELRVAVHETAGSPDGYAVWRVGPDSASGGAEVELRELVAAGPAAYLGLWRFLLSLDLVGQVRYRYGDPQEPLRWLADDPRRLGPTLKDGLWLRIVDLPAALAGRRYAAPVEVVLAVTDPLLGGNTGHWRLTGGPDRASCTRVTEPADLSCDIADLAAAYLGGTSLATLAAAGRLRELRPGTLAAASAGFGWPCPPVAIEGF